MPGGAGGDVLRSRPPLVVAERAVVARRVRLHVLPLVGAVGRQSPLAGRPSPTLAETEIIPLYEAVSGILAPLPSPVAWTVPALRPTTVARSPLDGAGCSAERAEVASRYGTVMPSLVPHLTRF